MELIKVQYVPSEEDEKDKLVTKIYKIHKYWSRKPWKPISETIKKHSNTGDLVVDLFLGSGVTCLESIILGRKFEGYDLNPIAIFIAENTVDRDIDLEKFEAEIDKLKSELSDFFKDLYSMADKCKFCEGPVVMDHLNIGPKYANKEEVIFFCENCNKKVGKRILSPSELKNAFKEYPIKNWIPRKRFPEKFYKDRFSYKGVKEVKDFYTNRNLYALSELLYAINNSNLKYKSLFLIAFSNTLLHVSKLKSENVRPLSVNNYWIPDDYMEENVWLRFSQRLKLVLESKRNLKARLKDITKIEEYKLHNKSSFYTKLEKESVDYILTDPPYGDAIQYSELSFIWNAWLSLNFDLKEEVVINPKQDKTISDYLSLLENSIKEANRILKYGGKFTLCFHNKEFKIWEGILDLFKKYNFALDEIEIVDTLGNSYNNNWAKFSPKSDIYLTFKKTKDKIKEHYKKIDLLDIIRKELEKEGDVSKIYDSIVTTLIWNIYHNEYKVDLSNLTIRKLGEEISKIKNGNR